MTSPLDESIPDPEQRRRIAEALAPYAHELASSPAMRVNKQLATLEVPDGGAIGRRITPHLETAVRVRDSARRWAPAAATSTAVTCAISLYPVPAPLTVYGIAVTGFAWWHCCGRPGPAAMTRALIYTAGDLCTAAAKPLRHRHRPPLLSPASTTH